MKLPRYLVVFNTLVNKTVIFVYRKDNYYNNIERLFSKCPRTVKSLSKYIENLNSLLPNYIRIDCVYTNSDLKKLIGNNFTDFL